MPNKKKLPDGVIRLDKLMPGDIRNNDVTCINITVIPEQDGNLEFEGSWKQLIKALLWLLYQVKSNHFTGLLYNAKIVDKDFQICKEAVGIVKNGDIVYAEKILGTPYYIDYDYSDKTLYFKARQIASLSGFNPKDVLLTLKPR